MDFDFDMALGVDMALDFEKAFDSTHLQLVLLSYPPIFSMSLSLLKTCLFS